MLKRLLNSGEIGKRKLKARGEKFLFKYFLKIDFAEILQRGSLDQNNQTQPLIFSKNCSTSGFMGNFRFRLVLKISRYIIDQSELKIAQIEAYDPIKIFYFASLGLGSLGGIWGHLGSKSKHFQT